MLAYVRGMDRLDEEDVLSQPQDGFEEVSSSRSTGSAADAGSKQDTSHLFVFTNEKVYP